jgi:hypothetical protein
MLMRTWYLSFADPKRPKGERWPGACFVEAATLSDALRAAWSSGCNPGGEVKGRVIPDPPATPAGDAVRAKLAEIPFGQLLDRERLARLGVA